MTQNVPKLTKIDLKIRNDQALSVHMAWVQRPDDKKLPLYRPCCARSKTTKTINYGACGKTCMIMKNYPAALAYATILGNVDLLKRARMCDRPWQRSTTTLQPYARSSAMTVKYS